MATHGASKITTADLRAEIAKRAIHKYIVAAAVRVNPILFSKILNERTPLPEAFAQRVMDFLESL